MRITLRAPSKRRALHPAAAFALAALAVAVAPACSGPANDDGAFVPIGDTQDGAPCAEWDECRSGSCHRSLCEGSPCRCEDGDCSPSGEPSDDCAAGWLCAHFVPEDPLGFLPEPRDQCVVPCPDCPAHHACNAKPYCEPIFGWNHT